MVDPEVVQQTVVSFTDFLLRYFVALAAVGAFAMAVIEFWKKLRASQTRYHGRMITRWFRQGEGAFDVSRRSPDSKVSSQAAYSELLQLTTGVDAPTADHTTASLWDRGGLHAGPMWVESRADYALFALPFDRMMGHVQDAADSALNNPKRYPSLFLFITTGADSDDVRHWFEQADVMPDGDMFDRADAKRRADLYARLNQLARRKIDGFQVFTEQRWVNWNQLWANVVGVAVLFIVLLWSRGKADGAEQLTWPVIFAFSLLGGVLSPVAKDIVTALSRVRGG
ncbi:MAG TPA: hypothetical protein VIR60_03300 [Gammaproteobacteria bacterium]